MPHLLWLVAIAIIVPAIAFAASFLDRRWEEWENRHTDD